MSLRGKYFVIVGSGPVSQECAEEFNADGYGEFAVYAPALVNELRRKGKSKNLCGEKTTIAFVLH